MSCLDVFVLLFLCLENNIVINWLLVKIIESQKFQFCRYRRQLNFGLGLPCTVEGSEQQIQQENGITVTFTVVNNCENPPPSLFLPTGTQYSIFASSFLASRLGGGGSVLHDESSKPWGPGESRLKTIPKKRKTAYRFAILTGS